MTQWEVRRSVKVMLQSQRHGMRSVAKRIRPRRCLPSNTAKSLRPMKRSASFVHLLETHNAAQRNGFAEQKPRAVWNDHEQKK